MIHLQKSASIQPRTSLSKFGGKFNSLFIRLLIEVAANFRKTYPTKDLELLWGALIKCYGTPALAEQAVFENPQILNPSYTFCNTMVDSQELS